MVMIMVISAELVAQSLKGTQMRSVQFKLHVTISYRLDDRDLYIGVINLTQLDSITFWKNSGENCSVSKGLGTQ